MAAAIGAIGRPAIRAHTSGRAYVITMTAPLLLHQVRQP